MLLVPHGFESLLARIIIGLIGYIARMSTGSLPRTTTRSGRSRTSEPFFCHNLVTQEKVATMGIEPTRTSSSEAEDPPNTTGGVKGKRGALQVERAYTCIAAPPLLCFS